MPTQQHDAPSKRSMLPEALKETQRILESYEAQLVRWQYELELASRRRRQEEAGARNG
jgi:hypothetical protein